jgi:hypothetical protein
VQVLSGELEAYTETESLAPPSGYAPVWAELRNKGAKLRQVVIEFRAYRGGFVQRVVTVEAGERVVAHLPVPARLGTGDLVIRPRGLAEGLKSVLVTPTPNGTLLVLGTEAQLDAFTPQPGLGSGAIRAVSYSPISTPRTCRTTWRPIWDDARWCCSTAQ